LNIEPTPKIYFPLPASPQVLPVACLSADRADRLESFKGDFLQVADL